MRWLLQIGNVRGNKLPHQDGTNRAAYQVQMPGTNPVSNPTHGTRNNLLAGMRKTLPNSNSLPLAGVRLTRHHSNNLPPGGKRLLNSNLPPGMRKTLPNSNNLPPGMHQVQQIREHSSRGKHLLPRPMHGRNLSRMLLPGGNQVTNPQHQHQQHMAMVAVQVSRGRNQLK